MSTTPQSDPQAMPLADLKQAAGLNDPPVPLSLPSQHNLLLLLNPNPLTRQFRLPAIG